MHDCSSGGRGTCRAVATLPVSARKVLHGFNGFVVSSIPAADMHPVSSCLGQSLHLSRMLACPRDWARVGDYKCGDNTSGSARRAADVLTCMWAAMSAYLHAPRLYCSRAERIMMLRMLRVRPAAPTPPSGSSGLGAGACSEASSTAGASPRTPASPCDTQGSIDLSMTRSSSLKRTASGSASGPWLISSLKRSASSSASGPASGSWLIKGVVLGRVAAHAGWIWPWQASAD